MKSHGIRFSTKRKEAIADSQTARVIDLESRVEGELYRVEGELVTLAINGNFLGFQKETPRVLPVKHKFVLSFARELRTLRLRYT